jgi:transposase
MAMTIVDSRVLEVTGGVDTHLDFHVAAALDQIGGLLGVERFETTEAGYRKLAEWLEGFGPVIRVGVEGTGSYGTGLARFLHDRGVDVVEVDRPNRQLRHRRGKSDPTHWRRLERRSLVKRPGNRSYGTDRQSKCGCC